MIYKWIYKTPDSFDDIEILSDGEFLTGLYFINSEEAMDNCKEEYLSIFKETVEWLDIYFSGKEPKFTPKYKLMDLTDFRSSVMDILKSIKYGNTMTYNDIAKLIAKKRVFKRMSSQAVGGAVGWNPICIIIPCHRVVGSSGNLTGYSGGINNKIALLKHEQNDMEKFFLPKK